MLNPFIPFKKANLSIIDGRVSDIVVNNLEKLNIKVIRTIKCADVSESISYHPDIVMHPLDHRTIVVAPNVYDYYRKVLSKEGLKIIKGETILKSKYPEDIAYNVGRLNGLAIHNLKYTDSVLKYYFQKENIEILNIKQGYSKCSLCIVDENSAITSDVIIYEKLKKLRYDILLIKPGYIDLINEKYGFIGGTSGNISKDEIIFSGKLHKHPDYERIVKFLKNKNKKIRYLSNENIVDIGTIINFSVWWIFLNSIAALCQNILFLRSDDVDSIKIGARLPKDQINELIFSYPFDSYLNVQFEEYDNHEFLTFNIDRNIISEQYVFSNIASLITNIIDRTYMKKIISTKVNDILQETYISDLYDVETVVYELLLDDNYFLKEKEIIKKDLIDYLKENDTLILDGYLRFRSKPLENLVDIIIDKVLNDIQMEYEFEEFIQLLRYYLDTQIPKVDLVNVIIKNNRYIMLDEDNNQLDNESINSIVKEYDIDDISEADLLLSSLIVSAPNRVVVHIKNDKEKELMIVLKKIFGGNLSFCYSCELCDKY